MIIGNILEGRLGILPKYIKAVENLFHAPSNFNITSLINRWTMSRGNEEDNGLIAYLLERVKNSMQNDCELYQIAHMGDRRGNLLCRLKEELL